MRNADQLLKIIRQALEQNELHFCKENQIQASAFHSAS
jgi:hypothetical protein